MASENYEPSSKIRMLIKTAIEWTLTSSGGESFAELINASGVAGVSEDLSRISPALSGVTMSQHRRFWRCWAP